MERLTTFTRKTQELKLFFFMRCRPVRSLFSKGGSIGGMSQTMSAYMLWTLTHTPPRGVWGHAPPEMFGNLDYLRVILRHSDSHYHSQLCHLSSPLC